MHLKLLLLLFKEKWYKWKFCFFDSKGNWKILINADSDHGGHLKEFTINIDDKFKIKDFEKPPYERYFTIISVLGFYLGFWSFFNDKKIEKIQINSCIFL